jgi:hypothetical protein
MTIKVEVPYGAWVTVVPAAMNPWFTLSAPRRGEIAVCRVSGDDVEPGADVFGHVLGQGDGCNRGDFPDGTIKARSLVPGGSFVSRDPDQ